MLTSLNVNLFKSAELLTKLDEIWPQSDLNHIKNKYHCKVWLEKISPIKLAAPHKYAKTKKLPRHMKKTNLDENWFGL